MDSNSYFYFRDYGLYDLAQLRLAARQDAKLAENFYLKTDGTRVYYFDEEYLGGLLKQIGFEVMTLETHYRVVKNKKRDLDMKRVWVQSICKKP